LYEEDKDKESDDGNCDAVGVMMAESQYVREQYEEACEYVSHEHGKTIEPDLPHTV
jgi:hypothetical protein